MSWTMPLLAIEIDPRHLVENGRRRRRIFEIGAARERARAVGAADDDAQTALCRHRYQALKRFLAIAITFSERCFKFDPSD